MNKHKRGETVVTLIPLKTNETQVPQTKQSNQSFMNIESKSSFIQCQSEIRSMDYPIQSQKMIESIIKEHEREIHISGLKSKNTRPDIKTVHDVLQQKYSLKENNDEIILLLVVLGWIYSLQFDLFAIDVLISIYFTYDSIKKLSQMDNDFHMNIITQMLSGPIAALIDFCYYYRYLKGFWIATVFRSLKIISFEFQKQNLMDIYLSLSNSIQLIFASAIIFAIFSYIFTIFYSQSSSYFSTFGTTAFTLLQILTLDAWGNIMKQLDQDIETFILVFLFITMLPMFFWFLISAFQIDVMILDELVKNNIIFLDVQMERTNINQQILVNSQSDSNLFDILYGTTYTRITTFIFVIQLYLIEEQLKYSIIYTLITLLISLLYSMHFFALTILAKQKILKYKSDYKALQVLFHFIAGPASLITILIELNLNYKIQITPVLLMLKLFTNQNVRDISYIIIIVLQKSFSPYLLIIFLTFLFLAIENQFYNGTVMGDLMQYIQMMTFDYGLKESLKDSPYRAFGEIVYILIIHFVLIPAFMAQSCEIFQIILGVQFRPIINEEVNIDFHGQIKDQQTQQFRKYHKRMEIVNSKNLIYTFFKSENLIFFEEQQEEKRLLKMVYQYLQKLQITRCSKIDNKEIELLTRLNRTQNIQIYYKSQIYNVNRESIKINHYL